MAESSHPLGYQCEFIDTVHGNFYCKQCSLVARRLTFTGCCAESYCHDCIADIQQQDLPCPECGQQNFTIMKPLKYQQQMNCLKVYCSMRNKGCDWSGTLDQLDAHLDPEESHCQYVDVKCPLHCEHTIPRNMVEQHVVSECSKRDHVCQYCGFRDSYEMVVDTHSTQCIYFPLQCPNFCGVTCERDVMGEHMMMCRLEEVACKFSGVGCCQKLKREDQDEHTMKNKLLHLTMTASALQQKMQEQEQKLQELEYRHEQKSQKQEIEFINKFEEQEKRFQEQERKFQEEICKTSKELRQQKHDMHEQKQKFEKWFEKLEPKFHDMLQERDKKFVELQEKTDQNEVVVQEIAKFISLKRTFAMKNFSNEREKDKSSDWKSPAMYTHVRGYKFCIGIDANGYGSSHGKAMRVEIWSIQGEYDHQLKWPTEASFTLELLNQHGGENVIHTLTKLEWEKPVRPYTCLCSFGSCVNEMNWIFIEHSKLKDFLPNDILYFHLSNVAVY